MISGPICKRCNRRKVNHEVPEYGLCNHCLLKACERELALPKLRTARGR